MANYIKTEWVDHIKDIETDEVLQQGTLYCARLMNNIEDGIGSAHDEIVKQANGISNLEVKVQVLENNLINNLPQKNFYEDFSNLDEIEIINGIYNETFKKIYA